MVGGEHDARVGDDHAGSERALPSVDGGDVRLVSRPSAVRSAIADPVPHLTVADGVDAATADALRVAIEPALTAARVRLFRDDSTFFSGPNPGNNLTNTSTITTFTRDQPTRGRIAAGDLTEREVLYLIDQEWAATAEDILWRRSKLGLRLTPGQAAKLDDFMRGRVTGLAAAAE